MPRLRAAFAAPLRSVARFRGRFSFASWSVAMRLNASSSSLDPSREVRSFGRVSEIAASSTASSEPCFRNSSAAVFSPTPFAPGSPSEGSPRSAMKSGTSSGGTP